MDAASQPLEGALAGLRVLDFSTLLPGPLATLLLAECGAEVIKIERPDGGDGMRNRAPAFGGDSAAFALPSTSSCRRPARSCCRCWNRPTCSSSNSVPASWSGWASATTACAR